MERVEVYAIKDGKVALGVYADDVEIACPLIYWNFADSCLNGWTDDELNCSVAEEKGMNAETVSEIIEANMDKISEDVVTNFGSELSAFFVSNQLQEAFGEGTEYSIITHDGMAPEAGLMYGNDECIDDNGKLCQYFQPHDSWMVYKCCYTIPEGETDWSNIDYSNPDDIEISDEWGYPD